MDRRGVGGHACVQRAVAHDALVIVGTIAGLHRATRRVKGVDVLRLLRARRKMNPTPIGWTSSKTVESAACHCTLSPETWSSGRTHRPAETGSGSTSPPGRPPTQRPAHSLAQPSELSTTPVRERHLRGTSADVAPVLVAHAATEQRHRGAELAGTPHGRRPASPPPRPLVHIDVHGHLRVAQRELTSPGGRLNTAVDGRSSPKFPRCHSRSPQHLCLQLRALRVLALSRVVTPAPIQGDDREYGRGIPTEAPTTS
jgi:hypothetical protein